jgi:uncharacterized protein (DUF697 family)
MGILWTIVLGLRHRRAGKIAAPGQGKHGLHRHRSPRHRRLPPCRRHRPVPWLVSGGRGRRLHRLGRLSPSSCCSSTARCAPANRAGPEQGAHDMTAATADSAWADARASNPTEALRQECRAMARRRAALAAATSLIPIPGIDLATDLALMTRLINRINEHFGLSEEQISRLSSQRQALVYRLLAGAGGTLAARLTTPVLIGRIVRIVGLRLTTMQAARLVPIAGQVVAAGIGYWSVNTVAMRHIAHCERIVGELQGGTAQGLTPDATPALRVLIGHAAVHGCRRRHHRRPDGRSQPPGGQRHGARHGFRRGQRQRPGRTGAPRQSGHHRRTQGSSRRRPGISVKSGRQSTFPVYSTEPEDRKLARPLGTDSRIARRGGGIRAARPVAADAAGGQRASVNCRRWRRAGRSRTQATREAIAAFRQRAAVVAEVLGKPYTIRHLSIHQSGQMPPIPMPAGRPHHGGRDGGGAAGADGSGRKPGDDDRQRPGRNGRLRAGYTPSNSCTCTLSPARTPARSCGRTAKRFACDIERGTPDP